MMSPKDIKQIKILVVAGMIIAILSGLASMVYGAYKIQMQVIAAQTRLEDRLDTIAALRQRDTLRVQMSLHDIAGVLDSVRDAVWQHTSQGKPKPFTPLVTRIPDVPASERMKNNIPLTGKDAQ